MRATKPSRTAVAPHSPDGFISAAVFRVVAVYVVVSVLWITLSDQLVVLVFSDPRHIALVSTIKGYVFVAATASLLAIMLHGYLKAQAEESNKLAMLMKLASDGIHILDLQGNVVQVNDRFCRMIGYSQDELLHMNVLDWAPDLPRAEFDRAVAVICESGDSMVFESQNRRKDGANLEVEISAAAIDVGGQRLLHCTSRDITDRKRAERALQESEARFRRMFNDSLDGIMFTSPDGRIHAANPAACRMLGMSEAEILAAGPARVLAPAEARASPDRPGPDNPPVFAGEMTMVRKDGTRFPVEVSASEFDEAGGGKRSTLIFRDITERKHAVEKMLAHTAQLRAYFHYGPVIAYTVALREGMQHTRWVSDNVTDLLGYSIEEVMSAEWWDRHVHPEDRETARAASARIFAEGTVTHEYRFARKDGSYMSICDEMRLTHDAADGTPEIVGSWSDVTERVHREAEIRKLSLALMQSPESVMVTNLNAEIEYVNDSFVRVSGYSRDEVIGRNPRLLNSGKTPHATHQSMWQALSRGETWEGEFINRRKDGSEYIEAVKMAPVREPDGRITHYVAIKDDITEKKRMAEELDRYQHHLEELVRSRTAELAGALERADAANFAKSSFLANMSHEIRTPMNAITGLSYLLLQSDLAPEQRDRLQKIDSSSRHLRSLIDDILDLSKIEAGKMVMERVPFDLRATVEEAFEIAGARARDKGLPIEIDIDVALPARVEGDALRLRQVLLNLGSNAAKFTETGRIRFRALRAGGEPLQVRFEFHDTGIGISANHQQNLFKPFEQADSSTTRRYGGTGLGLAISRRLVELMGGTIGVDSEPGTGSTFWVVLPFEPAQEAESTVDAFEQGPAAAGAELRRGLRTLLVEDDPINQEVARELLSAAGHLVDVAENGAEGLRRAEQGVYDLVLMDMQMPVMDGLSATAAIRKLPGYGHVPIIAMTGNAFAEDKQRCFDAGMNDFISKPVNPALLYERIAAWTQGQAPAATAQPDPPVPPAQPQSTATLAERIAHIDDLDIKSGFAAFAGFAVQERLLRMYMEQHAGDGPKIRLYLREEKIDDAIRAAHTLKGGAAIIGAVGVRAGAEKLEHLMRDGTTDLP